jgi:hypothetical protein
MPNPKYDAILIGIGFGATVAAIRVDSSVIPSALMAHPTMTISAQAVKSVVVALP